MESRASIPNPDKNVVFTKNPCCTPRKYCLMSFNPCINCYFSLSCFRIIKQYKKKTFFKLCSQTRKKRLKKSKKVFSKCVLDFNFAPITGSVFFIF